MNDYIDIYCERLVPGLWAEPLNALTNISFVLASLFAYLLAKKLGAVTAQTAILIVGLFAIGAGSFTFHTQATEWAQLADVLPILFYQLAFITLYAKHVMRLPWVKIGALLVLFFVAAFAFDRLPAEILNGSLQYAPAFLFLAGFALWHRKHAAREKGVLLLASGAFLLSLTFRSLDMALCPQIPLGLHFLWHLLNGFLLYLTARAYILNARNP
jgi:hypothetical protein